jgi:hypothetical protein
MPDDSPRAAARRVLAEKRIASVLKRHGTAIQRTLENKISDGGPNPQRIDPHVLTDALHRMTKDGRVVRERRRAGANWFQLASTPRSIVEARYAEQDPVYQQITDRSLVVRLGQTLEIAISRAINQRWQYPFFGYFRDLNDHGDDIPYSKVEPPSYQGRYAIDNDKKVDFLLMSPGAGAVAVEAKNIREWIYPDRSEIREFLLKSVQLNAVPVLIARRIHISTFFVMSKCGVILHENFNQLLPAADVDVFNAARDKLSLGYHDLRLGNQPDARLLSFIGDKLPGLLVEARARFDAFKDLLEAYATGKMPYEEFAARVRRRDAGVAEDSDEHADVPF